MEVIAGALTVLFLRGGNNVTTALVDECAKAWHSK